MFFLVVMLASATMVSALLSVLFVGLCFVCLTVVFSGFYTTVLPYLSGIGLLDLLSLPFPVCHW